jgi:hypothetical protein
MQLTHYFTTKYHSRQQSICLRNHFLSLKNYFTLQRFQHFVAHTNWKASKKSHPCENYSVQVYSLHTTEYDILFTLLLLLQLCLMRIYIAISSCCSKQHKTRKCLSYRLLRHEVWQKCLRNVGKLIRCYILAAVRTWNLTNIKQTPHCGVLQA